MSAFVVSKEHIDALVTAAIRQGMPHRGGYVLRWQGILDGHPVTRKATVDERDRIGQMLWDENVRSVSHRYEEYPDAAGLYVYRASKHTDPVVILKSLDCYEYQACEHDAWEASEAHAFCEALRRSVIHDLPGYKDGPWGIHSA